LGVALLASGRFDRDAKLPILVESLIHACG
jgi:hypothetical protein